MNLCPKCGGLLNTKEDKCPKCNTLLVKDNVEVLDLELPITKEEKERKIKEIPLEIKKVKNNKDKKVKIEKEEQESTTNFYSVIKIIIVLLLLITSIILISNIIIELDKKEPIKENYIYRNNGLYSDFISTENELISFNEDNTFAIYTNYKVLDNNYYKGTYEYKNGEEALKEMGYSIEEFNLEFKNTKIENVYSIKLKPLKSYFKGHDTTSNDINNSDIWWFILIINNDDNIQGYNKTLDIRYTFIRK